MIAMKARFPWIGLLAIGAIAAMASVACGYPRPMSSERPASAAPAATVAVPSTVSAHRVSFSTEIRPIFETRCQPCHFKGGQMYERLPFDRAETIVGLGEKLFTRIKDEGEQGRIREFLAQEAPDPGR
jgi:hypothetical protein